jgi:hypothetical protein
MTLIHPVFGTGLTSLGSIQFSGMSLIEGVTSDQTELHEGNGYSPPPKIEAESPQIALIPEFSNLNSTLVPPWTVEADQL